MGDVIEKNLATKYTSTTASDLAKIENTTACVRMVDADGKSVLVTRNSIMAVIRDCLKDVIADQGTNAANFLTLLSSGVIGKTTKANAVSLLGAAVTYKDAITDLNSLNYVKGVRIDCFVSESLNDGNGVDNRPSDAGSKLGWCLTFGAKGYSGVVQKWFKYDGSEWTRIFWTTSSSYWKAWKKVTVT